MEPTDLNSPSDHPGDDAVLTALLREAEPPLPDNGFSARVLAALPPPPPAPFGLRVPILTAATIAGLVLAWQHITATGGAPAVVAELDARLSQIHAALALSNGSMVDPALTFALAATVGSLLYAFRAELRRFI